MIPFDCQMPPPLPPKLRTAVRDRPDHSLAQSSVDLTDCHECRFARVSDGVDSLVNIVTHHLSADDLTPTRSLHADASHCCDGQNQRQTVTQKTISSRTLSHKISSPSLTELNGALGNQSQKSFEYSFSTKTTTTTTTQTFRCTSIPSMDQANQFWSDSSSLSAQTLATTSNKTTTSRIDTLIDQMKAFNTNNGEEPPKLPVKMRQKDLLFNNNNNNSNIHNNNCHVSERPPSQYDNLTDGDSSQVQKVSHSWTNHHKPCSHSLSCPRFSTELNGSDESDSSTPPPLPPKRRNVMAYLEVAGYQGPVDQTDFFRHSFHSYKRHVQVQNQWQQMQVSFLHRSVASSRSAASSNDSMFSSESEPMTPPLLPPKKNKPSLSASSFSFPKEDSATSHDNHHSPRTSTPISQVPSQDSGISQSLDLSNQSISDQRKVDPEPEKELGPLDKLDVNDYLIYKEPNDEGPEIRGGPIDALIVKATEVTKNDFIFQESFLTTYRTLLSPANLIDKLLYRYNKFIHLKELRQQRAARNAFVLLVRVVDEMCVGDCSDELIIKLDRFVQLLEERGDQPLAKFLRLKLGEKMEHREQASHTAMVLLPSIGTTLKQCSLLDFKSVDLAEQMTLLDSELFLKIEIPEVLIWAKEQKEEMIPNLNTFTEHFNKMSYWARSRILEQEEAKDRERLVLKFIKIMKHLRKLNNFNSYLAILSALDSAPIRRLEWQKSITEGLKEYCALIDSSSSFRAYRQALAETEPPCIPYIGLILQDLTFVHIGNNDYLPDGNVNFAKRWQQYNILDQMRRFKNCHYQITRNEAIIAFFNNFDNYLSEEAMWQISESIKPRGAANKTETRKNRLNYDFGSPKLRTKMTNFFNKSAGRFRQDRHHNHL